MLCRSMLFALRVYFGGVHVPRSSTPVVFARHRWNMYSCELRRSLAWKQPVLASEKSCSQDVGISHMPSGSDKEVGSKTVAGLTYLELRLLNVRRLQRVSGRGPLRKTGRRNHTRLEIMILDSPVAAGAVGTDFVGLAFFVCFWTPPTGASGAAGRPGPLRRAPRPRRLDWRRVLRMSSRDWSSFPVDMMAFVVVVMAMSGVLKIRLGGWRGGEAECRRLKDFYVAEKDDGGSDGKARRSGGWKRFVTGGWTRCRARDRIGERGWGSPGCRCARWYAAKGEEAACCS